MTGFSSKASKKKSAEENWDPTSDSTFASIPLSVVSFSLKLQQSGKKGGAFISTSLVKSNHLQMSR